MAAIIPKIVKPNNLTNYFSFSPSNTAKSKQLSKLSLITPDKPEHITQLHFESASQIKETDAVAASESNHDKNIRLAIVSDCILTHADFSWCRYAKARCFRKQST